MANAYHHRSDAYSSVVALIAILGSGRSPRCHWILSEVRLYAHLLTRRPAPSPRHTLHEILELLLVYLLSHSQPMTQPRPWNCPDSSAPFSSHLSNQAVAALTMTDFPSTKENTRSLTPGPPGRWCCPLAAKSAVSGTTRDTGGPGISMAMMAAGTQFFTTSRNWQTPCFVGFPSTTHDHSHL
jgi:hypothetical protein